MQTISTSASAGEWFNIVLRKHLSTVASFLYFVQGAIQLTNYHQHMSQT